MLRTRIDKSGRWLTIKIPMQEPKVSKSGKNLVVATSCGAQRDEATFDGRPIFVIANAYLKPDKATAPKVVRKKGRARYAIDEAGEEPEE